MKILYISFFFCSLVFARCPLLSAAELDMLLCEGILYRIIEDLESDDTATQKISARKIVELFDIAKEAVPSLEGLLVESPVMEVRLAAAEALWILGAESDDIIPILQASLKDEEFYNREASARILERMGPKGAPAVSLLIETLNDEDPDVRIHAAWALGAIGPKAKPAVPALVTALKDHAKSSVGSIIHILSVSDAARRGLRGIGPDAIPAVVPLLKDSNKDVRQNAMRVLAGGGIKSKPYIPLLIAALDDGDATIRIAAIQVLGELRVSPSQTIPALAKKIESDDENMIRYFAAHSLAKYGPVAVGALPTLIKALSDKHAGVRARAADALGQIGPAAVNALPELQRLCKDDDLFVYQHASINTVAPHARKAIEKIRAENNWA